MFGSFGEEVDPLAEFCEGVGFPGLVFVVGLVGDTAFWCSGHVSAPVRGKNLVSSLSLIRTLGG